MWVGASRVLGREETMACHEKGEVERDTVKRLIAGFMLGPRPRDVASPRTFWDDSLDEMCYR